MLGKSSRNSPGTGRQPTIFAYGELFVGGPNMSFGKVPNFLGEFFTSEMAGSEHLFFRFKSFLLDASERELRMGEEVIPLAPKAFDTLVYLVRNGGHLVTKDELMNAIWPDSFVEEGNLPRTIHTLRKALGEDDNGNKFIKTVPTRGYRFVADVEKVAAQPDSFGEDTTAREVGEDAPLVGSGLVTTNEPTSETGKRRHFFILAAAFILIALATGFWISNGTIMPHSLGVALARHSANGEAYRHFQQGRLLAEIRTPESYEGALENYEKAIEIDPDYAEAYAGLADAKAYLFDKSHANDDIASARGAVKRALELDENNSYARTMQCRITGTNDWEFDEAVTECQRAVALGPNDSEAHRELGFALNVVGRMDEALAEMETAVALSPTSFNKRSRALVLYMSRRYDEAINESEQVEATDPNYTDAERWLLACFAMKNDQANAFEHLVKLQEATGASPDDLSAAKAAFAAEGWPAALHVTLNSPSGIGTRGSMLIAGLFAQIGEKNKAFEVLNDMHKRRAIMLITVAREPLLDPLRDDPRFGALLSQMKLK